MLRRFLQLGLKSLFAGAIFTTCFFVQNDEALAQKTLVPSQWTDLSIADHIGNVEHTGADYWESTDGNRLRVVCWDGNQPGIGWSYTYAVGVSGPQIGHQPIETVTIGHSLDGKAVISAGLTVTDPDVVVWQTSQGAWLVALTFLQEVNDRIQVLQSIYTYEPGSNSLKLVQNISNNSVTYPQLVSSSTGNTQCSTPNVDVGRRGGLVFVYSDNGNIFARPRPISSFSDAYPDATQPSIVQVSSSDPQTCYDDEINFSNIQPDVAVWEDERSVDQAMVHICFIQESYGSFSPSLPFIRRILSLSTDFSNLMTTSWPLGCQSYTLVHRPFTNADDDPLKSFLSAPRIAPFYNSADPTAYTREDWLMTWLTRQVDGAQSIYAITTATYSAASSSISIGDLTDNDKAIIAPCQNVEPAIGHYYDQTYNCNSSSDGTGVCVWSFKQTSPCFQIASSLDGYEIIGQPISMSAHPICFQSGIEFMQVNREYSGDQYAPSVSGGHGSAMNQLGRNMFFAWVSGLNEGSIAYKDSYPFPTNNPNINYRQAKKTGQEFISIVPAPSNYISQLRVDLLPKERVESIRVVDLISGCMINVDVENQAINDNKDACSLIVPLENLRQRQTSLGLFVIQVVTTARTGTVHFNLQPN